jgi:hypothetical protein
MQSYDNVNAILDEAKSAAKMQEINYIHVVSMVQKTFFVFYTIYVF